MFQATCTHGASTAGNCFENWGGSLPSTAETMTTPEIIAVWREYFVFTVVRNPLDRATSMYKFLMGYLASNCTHLKASLPLTWFALAL